MRNFLAQFSLDLMQLPKFRYVLLSGAVVGIVVPIVLFLYVSYMREVRLEPMWMFFVWPTSIMLMATENLGHSAEAFGILALSVASNALLYIGIFSLIWCVGWVFRAWRASLRDGTTI
jgi:hypothetical protein